MLLDCARPDHRSLGEGRGAGFVFVCCSGGDIDIVPAWNQPTCFWKY